jgi:protein involved in polysaccharide export with SLBB domain
MKTAAAKTVLTSILLCLAAGATLSRQDAAAQQAAAPVDAAAASAQPSPRGPDLYRIGPGDVLGIRVSAGRFVPELSADSVEVDECGRIPLPSVQYEQENEIQAAGLTRVELAERLRNFYLKYKRNPQVLVTIKSYNSQPVVIQGAISKPAQFQLRRAVRLFELVQFYAGGPTGKAGGRIQIARMPNFYACAPQAPAAQDDSQGGGIAFLDVDLRELLKGSDRANPYLQPGDVITVLEAQEAYVVGNVLRPGPVLLNEEKVTVWEAIARAGGTMPDTKRDKIRVIRQKPGTDEKEELFVNLKAIDDAIKGKGDQKVKAEALDIALQPNDIVEVQTSGGKRLLRSLMGTVVPTMGQLPVRVIQ